MAVADYYSHAQCSGVAKVTLFQNKGTHMAIARAGETDKRQYVLIGIFYLY